MKPHGAVLRRVGGRAAEVVGVDARPVGEREDRAVAGSMTIAVAPLGRHFAPTSARTSSTLPCSCGVERQLEVLAGHRRFVSCRTIGVAERVLDDAPLAVRAAQRALERVLEAAEALAVDCRRRRAPATRATGAGSRGASSGMSCRPASSSFCDLRGLAAGQVAREVDEAAVARRASRAPRPASGRAAARAWPRPWPGRLTRYGVAAIVGRGLGDGELDAVAIGDRAAPRRDVELVDLLGGGGALQATSLDAAEPQGAARGHDAAGRGRSRTAARCAAR